MLKALLAAPLLAVILIPCASATAEQTRQTNGAQTVNWRYSDHRLQLSRRGTQTSLDSADLPASLAAKPLVKPGDPLSFALEWEAGSLACSGEVTEPGEAAGTCRFSPDSGFVERLASHGLSPDDEDDLLAMALVDAHLGTVEELATRGIEVEDSDDLIAMSALGITGAYAASLAEAGLAIDDLQDLIAAKAVGVDAAWVQEMAAAGYAGLDADQAVQMRVLHITPDYARRMARVLAVTEGH